MTSAGGFVARDAPRGARREGRKTIVPIPLVALSLIPLRHRIRHRAPTKPPAAQARLVCQRVNCDFFNKINKHVTHYSVVKVYVQSNNPWGIHRVVKGVGGKGPVTNHEPFSFK